MSSIRMILRAAAVIGLPLGAGAAASAPPPLEVPNVRINVTAQELVDRPIDARICGNFIEAGFGRQVEGLWAEMLFNRSFELLPPYTTAQKGAGGHEPGPDVESQDWWHSGYEEPPWELAPGNVHAHWTITEHVNFWKGQRGGWLANKSTTQWAGVAQRGVYLRKGERYVFTGMLRTGAHEWNVSPDRLSIDAELRLYADGDWSKPLAVHLLRGIRNGFALQETTIDNPDFAGRATFSLWIPPGANLGMDALSLMPLSNRDGWRADVVEASERVRPRILRWPGGCFASFYHWREGIGARAERSAVPSWFWGGLYDNDVGTAEFVQFCRLIGAEPLICINMLTGDPEEAADWVAYCNAPATDLRGKLRARDGFAQPFGVRHWELDNEAFRRFTPAQYIERCTAFAQAMKAVDPTIELTIIGYDGYRPVVGELLGALGSQVAYVSDRAIDEPTLRSGLDVIRAYNRAHGTSIRLCNTEWPAPDQDVPPAVDLAALEKIGNFKARSRCWYCGLNVAKTLLGFQRLGGDFAYSNFNNFGNTWGHNVLECPKDGVYLSPVGRVFELLSRSPAAWPLKTEASSPEANVIVQAAWDQDRSALCLVAINYNASEVRLSFALEALGKRFPKCALAVLRADSLLAHSTPANPEVIERQDSTLAVPDGTQFDMTVAPFSLSQAVLR